MAFESMLGELTKEDSIDANKILHELLDYSNIDTKTHMADPIAFAMLESLVAVLEETLLMSKEQKARLPMTEKFLKSFIEKLKKFLVSWNRLSRQEVTETLKANREQDSTTRSLFQKLTGMNR